MANELKHTPGPWAASKDTAFVRTADDDQFAVAAVYGYRGGAAEDEVALANSRLIAAAPELLEALRELRGEIVYNDEGSMIPSEFDAMLERADAAIAKATGAA